MITATVIEQRRTPRALRDFVLELKRGVRADEHERHCGIQKAGLYKEFLDEIIPLSVFAVHMYPEAYEILPVLGNQGFDALVFDGSGKEVDRIEITVPHDGASAAIDARLTVNRGYGKTWVGTPGDDFDDLFPWVIAACHKKAIKDYGDCSLVIAIDPMPAFETFEARYESQIEALVAEISMIQFRARRVFLLVMPDRIRKVCG